MNLLAAAGLALLAGAGLGATAPAAGAQEPQSPQSASGADRLSQAQLPEARRSAEVAKRLFSRIDQNDDGQITPEEWSDWHDTEFVAASKSSQGRPAAD